jgi:uncharacterized protein YjiS (DUF1127 family)
VLRRNIIAFQCSADPYFPFRTIIPVTDRRKTRGKIMFASMVRFIREWRHYNQSLRELSRLGDRELADIGISRSDLHRVAWNSAHH